MKKVAIIVLNFKGKEDTLECMRSIKASDYKNLEIIVVDNNSKDGLEGEISKMQDVVFIQTGENLGYAGGNNVGIKKALDDNSDYIFVLNPDTEIEKNTISNLVKEAEGSDAGIFGPKIYFHDTKVIWYGGGIIDQNNILGVHRGMDEVDKGQYNEIVGTGFASGAAMFVKSQVFKTVGLFDERYFLYLEDMEFCLRAKLAGFKSLYNPTAVVYHKNAKSTGLGSPLQDYFITRNRLLFAFQYMSWRKRLALLKHIILTMNFSTRRQGLLDFSIGNFGKGSYIK